MTCSAHKDHLHVALRQNQTPLLFMLEHKEQEVEPINHMVKTVVL